MNESTHAPSVRCAHTTWSTDTPKVCLYPVPWNTGPQVHLHLLLQIVNRHTQHKAEPFSHVAVGTIPLARRYEPEWSAARNIPPGHLQARHALLLVALELGLYVPAGPAKQGKELQANQNRSRSKWACRMAHCT